MGGGGAVGCCCDVSWRLQHGAREARSQGHYIVLLESEPEIGGPGVRLWIPEDEIVHHSRV